jgi:hypothetical protein
MDLFTNIGTIESWNIILTIYSTLRHQLQILIVKGLLIRLRLVWNNWLFSVTLRPEFSASKAMVFPHLKAYLSPRMK